MISEITGIEHVSTFFHDLFHQGVNAHPDEDFTQYINIKTQEPTFTPEGAALRNDLMRRAFEVCQVAGVDIYDLMHEIYLKETKLDQFIPLPSQRELD